MEDEDETGNGRGKWLWENRQSITEVLQDPDGGNFHSPDVAFAGGAKASLEESVPITLKTFEAYLMLFTERYEEYRALEAFATEKDIVAPTRERTPAQRDELSTVPRVYFDPTFTLEMSQEVGKLPDDIFSDSGPVKAAQGQLARYLQLVEGELHWRIRERKRILDTAMDQVEQLHEFIAQAHSITSALRTTTATALRSMEGGSLMLMKLDRRRKNLGAVLDTLNAGQDARMAPQLVEMLLRAGDYGSAMDATSAAHRALQAGHVARLEAFNPARKRLDLCATNVDEGLWQHVATSLDELERPQVGTGELQDDVLRATVALLERVGRTEAFLDWLTQRTKRRLQETAEDSREASMEALSEMEKVVSSAAHVLEMVHDKDRVALCGEVLCGAAQEHAANVIQKEMSDVYALVDDGANGYAGVKRVGAALEAAKRFGDSSELVFGVRRGRFSLLRSALSERSNAYSSALHKRHSQKLASALRSERWSEVKVPRDVQLLVVELREMSMGGTIPKRQREPKRGKKDYEFVSLDDDDDDDDYEDDGGDDGDAGDAGDAVHRRDVHRIMTSASSIDGEAADVLYVGAQKLKVVSACLVLVRSVVLYATAARTVPFAEDLGRRCLDLLQSFHEITGQQVLGTRAIQTVGLRGISARHLALASQSLALAGALLPHLSDAVREYVTPAAQPVLTRAVDSLTRDLQLHKTQLLDKIFNVMMERFGVQRDALLALPWNEEQQLKREPVPSVYMTSLVYETNVLHRILLNILARRQLFDIYTQLGAAYGEGLRQAYSTLDNSRDYVRRRIGSDVTYLRLKLRAMEAVISTSTVHSMQPVEDLWKTYVSAEQTHVEATEAGHDTTEVDKRAAPDCSDKKEDASPPSDTPSGQPPRNGTTQAEGAANGNGSTVEDIVEDIGDEDARLMTPVQSDEGHAGSAQTAPPKGQGDAELVGNGDHEKSSDPTPTGNGDLAESTGSAVPSNEDQEGSREPAGPGLIGDREPAGPGLIGDREQSSDKAAPTSL